MPVKSILYFYENTLVIFLSVLRLGVFPHIFAGWSSNSKYSLLGIVRIVSQIISYEIRFTVILISLFFYVSRISFIDMIYFQFYFKNIVFSGIGIFILFFRFLVELHRIPFDFSERESELVSGYNVEYGGILFTFIFLGEYINMIFLIYFYVFLIFGIYLNIYSSILTLFFLLILIILRGTLPRCRYDQLIGLC